MKDDALYLTKVVKDDIRILSQDAYPYEGCGVLLKRKEERKVTKVVSLENIVSKDKANIYFLLDSLEMYQFEKEMSLQGMEIAGFFHSHPDHKAMLSNEDERFMIPGMAYIISEVNKGVCEDIKVYYKDEPDERGREIRLAEEL